MIDPSEFVISRRRKKYKFAQFANLANCFEADEWHVVPADKPIHLELGAGTGYFLVEIARRYPQNQYVAVDVKADRLQAGARRAIEQKVTNISFVRAHADQLSELFSQGSITTLWLTFSDPFPKARHAKHRMTHPRFLKIYADLLVKNGKLLFKTDNHDLFDWSLEQLVTEGWNITAITYDLHESDFDEDAKIMTTYETRYTSEGLPVYTLSASC